MNIRIMSLITIVCLSTMAHPMHMLRKHAVPIFANFGFGVETAMGTDLSSHRAVNSTRPVVKYSNWSLSYLLAWGTTFWALKQGNPLRIAYTLGYGGYAGIMTYKAYELQNKISQLCVHNTNQPHTHTSSCNELRQDYACNAAEIKAHTVNTGCMLSQFLIRCILRK